MRIECPACATAYEVPADRLAVGQVVRCARCETDWTPLEPDAPDEPVQADVRSAVVAAPEPLPPEIEPEPEPIPEPPPPSPLPRARGKLGLRLAWALSLLLVAGALWGAYTQRDQVMHAWPPSTRAYAAMGLIAKPGPQAPAAAH